MTPPARNNPPAAQAGADWNAWFIRMFDQQIERVEESWLPEIGKEMAELIGELRTELAALRNEIAVLREDKVTVLPVLPQRGGRDAA